MKNLTRQDKQIRVSHVNVSTPETQEGYSTTSPVFKRYIGASQGKTVSNGVE